MAMQWALFLCALAALTAVPAEAEKLSFDHRLAPALKNVLDAGDPAMIDFNDKNPKYVTDLIAVRGKSARDWREALLIVARTPQKAVRTAGEWVAEIEADVARKCQGGITRLAEDAQSITLERRSTGCPKNYPPVAIYKVVGGKRSLFMLAVLAKDDLSETARKQWRAMLDSAQIQ
jgi:hypothetical protein